jgi:hypothetical protein
VYLFTHKALAKVFRTKLLAALAAAGLALPERYPEAWVVDCKAVRSGESALIYLVRYLYRGVLAEKDNQCELVRRQAIVISGRHIRAELSTEFAKVLSPSLLLRRSRAVNGCLRV